MHFTSRSGPRVTAASRLRGKTPVSICSPKSRIGARSVLAQMRQREIALQEDIRLLKQELIFNAERRRHASPRPGCQRSNVGPRASHARKAKLANTTKLVE